MTNVIWIIKRTPSLEQKDLLAIAQLKDQHWQHGIESQIKWLLDNSCDDDCHLMGTDAEGHLIAYLNLNVITVRIDSIYREVIGIGGVCTDQSIQGMGIGKQLMRVANAYILEQGKQGILLCKESLLPFYEKCEWNTVAFKNAVVQNAPYYKLIMAFPADDMNHCEIIIPRNF